MKIHVVDASRALAWIKDGYALFRLDPLVWVVQVVVALVVSVVLSLLPFIGQLANMLLSMVLAAGFFWSCEQGRLGQPMKVEYLFAGFRQNTSPLLVLGLIYLAGSVLVGVAAVAMAIGAGIGVGSLAGGWEHGEEIAAGAATLGVLAMVLLVLLLSLPLAMAAWFAAPLVMLGGVEPMVAMKLSFMGCLQNWLAFLLYGFAFLLLGLLASIPFALGWLVLLPVLIGSTYTAYREIFQPCKAE